MKQAVWRDSGVAAAGFVDRAAPPAARAARAGAASVIRLHAASVHFGALAALDRVDLDIARGERLALVGANGSGKSTLLRLANGLLAPTTGSVWRAPMLRQAMLFQRPRMLRLSALSNVALGRWIGGMRWRDARRRALSALAQVGLSDLAARAAPALSIGQQQRLAMARALSLEPELLLLDEPTASLDPHAKCEVEALMASFSDAGMTLVFASHNLGQVKRLATRVVYLEHGRLLADLPVEDFFNAALLRPASAQAASFVKGELG